MRLLYAEHFIIYARIYKSSLLETLLIRQKDILAHILFNYDEENNHGNAQILLLINFCWF
jgi:hypothetical protein